MQDNEALRTRNKALRKDKENIQKLGPSKKTEQQESSKKKDSASSYKLAININSNLPKIAVESRGKEKPLPNGGHTDQAKALKENTRSRHNNKSSISSNVHTNATMKLKPVNAAKHKREKVTAVHRPPNIVNLIKRRIC